MTTDPQAAASTLNKLIEVCLDGELGYRTAASHIQNTNLHIILSDNALRRAEFAKQLRAEVERLGAHPSHSGSVVASLHRGWIALKSAVSHGSAKAIIAACETGEDSAFDIYVAAIKSDLPAETRALIETQWRAVDDSRRQLRHINAEIAAGKIHAETD
ncbi:MAG TPA: PA2169 family four-helix-bundle protein [Bryobacteraceae bacterium]|nr:PA2169 family four-helix-bundle protein [Bryobacteraceae bacterium]